MDKVIKGRIEAIQNYKFIEGYKSTEIGLLPSDWSVTKLSDIVEEIKQTAGTDSYETVSISAGIGFVNQAAKFGKELSGKQYEKYTVLHKGDFSYNKGNSNKYPQGCIYRLIDREVAAAPNVFESFRIINECAEYYDQLFTSGFLNKQLARMINHGVRDDGLLNLTAGDFYSCILPLPPLNEQKRIAQILEHYDHVIELHEEKANKYRQLKRTCLSKMFPQKRSRVPEWRFPDFTDDWEQRKLGELLEMSLSNNTLSRAELNYEKGAIKSVHYGDILIKYGAFVSAKNEVIPYITDGKVEDYKTNLLQDGDILFADTAEDETTGKAIEIGDLQGENVVAGLHTIACRPTLKMARYYLGYYLNSNSYHSQLLPLMQGIKVLSLSRTNLANTVVKFPVSEVEQAQIGGYFRQLDNLITLQQREIDGYKRFKQALTRLLLTGIARVNK